jgi:hypothetical protein
MVLPVLSPEQRQGALVELERVIARLNRARANQLAAIHRLAAVHQPAARMLGLLHATEKHLACLYKARQVLLAQEQPPDLSEDVR